MHVFLSELEVSGAGNGWFRMDAGDGFYVPAGAPYRVHNMTEAPARYLFGVAPTYLAEDRAAQPDDAGPP